MLHSLPRSTYLKDLRFTGTRITNEEHVDIYSVPWASSASALGNTFVCPTEKLQQDTLLHNLVAIDGRSDAFHKSRIDMVRTDHLLKLCKLRLGQRARKGFTVAFASFLLPSDIRAKLDHAP